jgi:transcriptional regulator with XRE-family HTH domain
MSVLGHSANIFGEVPDSVKGFNQVFRKNFGASGKSLPRNELSFRFFAEEVIQLTETDHFARLGRALRQLREKAGLSQVALQAKAGLGASTVSDWERGVSTPHLDSVNSLLNAMGLNVFDLARALDQVDGTMKSPDNAGQARPRWVSQFVLRPKFDVDTLYGYAFGVIAPEDPSARQDFIASVSAAATALAQEAVRLVEETADSIPEPEGRLFREEMLREMPKAEKFPRDRAPKPPAK